MQTTTRHSGERGLLKKPPDHIPETNNPRDLAGVAFFAVWLAYGMLGLMLEPTKLKVSLAFEPSAVMAAMQTTMIRASITAYSTAVGPSSFFRNDTSFFAMLRISDTE